MAEKKCGARDPVTGCKCTLGKTHSDKHISREDPMTELHWHTPKADAVIKKVVVPEPDDEVEDDEEYERAASWMALMGEVGSSGWH